MKSIIGAVCATVAVLALTPSQAWANPQHERMKRCNAEAREQALKGDARKAFMSTCLRGKHEAGAPEAPAAAQPAVAPSAGASSVGAPASVAAAPAAATPAASPLAAAGAAVASGAAPALAVADGGAGDDKARAKACDQSATEQSLRGAKRKAFIAECLKG